MFKGINIAGAGFGPVGTTLNGVPQTGALELRNNSTLRSQPRQWKLRGTGGTVGPTELQPHSNPGNENLPFVPPGVNGAVLRYNRFPENFILTNPQFGCSIGCTSGAATLLTNGGHSNYHSLQLLQTLRNVAGFNFQTSYTWSKELGIDPNSAPNGVRRAVLPIPRTSMRITRCCEPTAHMSSGPTARSICRLVPARSWPETAMAFWPASSKVGRRAGLSISSRGLRITIAAQSMLYRLGTPDQVRPFDFKGTRGVQWANGANSGLYFGDVFKKVQDPQCAAIDPSLQPFCTLQAVADKSGNIILQNPQPGTRGNVGLNTIEGAGIWSADMALTKSFKIRETPQRHRPRGCPKRLQSSDAGCACCCIRRSSQLMAGPSSISTTQTRSETCPSRERRPDTGSPSQRAFQLKVRVDF